VLQADDGRSVGQGQEKGSDCWNTPARQHDRKHEETAGRTAGGRRREAIEGTKIASGTESVRGVISHPQEPIPTVDHQEGK